MTNIKQYPCVSWDETHLMIHVDPVYIYEFGLDTIKTAHDVCDWLGQIEEKSWSTNELLGELVRAFIDIIGDLRGLK